MSQTRTFDCVVVGAGIVGAACAMRLARNGSSVAVVDERGVATGTTAAGMGHIVVMDDSDAQFALTEYSQRLWDEFAETLPANCEHQNCGTIWVAADGDELAEAGRKHDFYKARGVRSEMLDEKTLRDAEPNLREGLAGGLLVPGDSVVYQPRASAEFVDDAILNGAETIFGRRVVKVTNDGVEFENGDRIEAGNVVVAAGIGSTDLLAGVRIRRKKGHLVITERYPDFVSHQIVELGYLKSAHTSASDSVAFNVQPRATEQVLIGSSRQYDIDDPAVDYEILGRMTRRAFEYMPALASLVAVRVWTGFRPATDDNLPLIGRHPEMANVFLATGHEGLGITTSTGTAAIIADLIAGREPAIDASPYDPARIF